MNKMFELPDTDWVIIKTPKNNGDPGYWHILHHKHGTRVVPTYRGGGTHFPDRRYKCVVCGELVPETAEGFKNLCDWSEA